MKPFWSGSIRIVLTNSWHRCAGWSTRVSACHGYTPLITKGIDAIDAVLWISSLGLAEYPQAVLSASNTHVLTPTSLNSKMNSTTKKSSSHVGGDSASCQTENTLKTSFWNNLIGRLMIFWVVRNWGYLPISSD